MQVLPFACVANIFSLSEKNILPQEHVSTPKPRSNEKQKIVTKMEQKDTNYTFTLPDLLKTCSICKL